MSLHFNYRVPRARAAAMGARVYDVSLGSGADVMPGGRFKHFLLEDDGTLNSHGAEDAQE